MPSAAVTVVVMRLLPTASGQTYPGAGQATGVPPLAATCTEVRVAPGSLRVALTAVTVMALATVAV